MVNYNKQTNKTIYNRTLYSQQRLKHKAIYIEHLRNNLFWRSHFFATFYFASATSRERFLEQNPRSWPDSNLSFWTLISFSWHFKQNVVGIEIVFKNTLRTIHVFKNFNLISILKSKIFWYIFVIKNNKAKNDVIWVCPPCYE